MFIKRKISIFSLLLLIILISFSVYQYKIKETKPTRSLLDKDALEYTKIWIEPSKKNSYENNDYQNFTFSLVNINKTYSVNFTHWGEWQIIFYMPDHGVQKRFDYDPTIVRGTRIFIEPEEREYITTVSYRPKYEGLTYVEIYIEGAGVKMYNKTSFLVK